MARGDGSGGVGWLITFACLALVGLIGTGVLFIDSSGAHKTRDAAIADKQKADAAVRNTLTEASVYKTIISGAGTTNADVIKNLEQIPNLASVPNKAEVDKYIADFKAKIELFGPNYTEARSLSSLVSYLNEEINRKNQALVDEQNKTAKMLGDLAKSIDENKKIAEEAVKGQQAAEADLTKARAEFEKQRAEASAKSDEVAKKLDDLSKQLSQIEVFKRQVEEKEKELVATRKQLEIEVAKTREGDADLAKVPVADVVFANQLADTITINRGLQDGVRRQMTFSVYGKDETNLARATPKAAVEVVQVTGPNTSECRIISGKLRDPIVKGDVLYTPAWKPGQKVHFALGPNMDLNGDGDYTADELETLRGLIALNGGVVDSWVEIDGTVKVDKESGGMGFYTRFFVVGLPPRRDQKEMVATFDKQVEQFGVEKINIGKMLDYMGYSVKRATRSIVSSPTPVLERRPPGASQPVDNLPAPETKETPPAAPPGDDPFTERKPPAEAPKKPADPGEDPFANPK
jgi:hypothetical protein